MDCPVYIGITKKNKTSLHENHVNKIIYSNMIQRRDI